MTSETWPAPAKINLFLHIVGRRPDGYHELQTVFQLLEFGDEMQFRPDQGGQIKLDGNYPGVRLEEDLVFRAASLLKSEAGVSQGVTISINKRIPMGGGLGGGSTDAATTLVALNRIWETGLTVTELARLGLGLGADVPVFIHGNSAWAEGIGEKLVPLELPEQWFVVIHPGCQVNTSQIFSHPDLTRNSAPITIRDFDMTHCRNDCEALVYTEFPEVAEAAEWLGQWTQSHLTGTGACIFGGFKSIQSANRVFEQLPPKWQGFVSKGINRSPLLE